MLGRIQSWRWWPLVAVGALIAVALWGSSLPPTKTHNAQRTSQSGQDAQREAPQIAALEGTSDTTNERIANYTFWLTWFTGLLFLVGAVQGILIYEQIKLARAQHFALHRPRLVLKEVFIREAEGVFTLMFEVANIGEGDAVIIDGFVAINFISDKQRFRDLKEANLGRLERNTLKPGKIEMFTKAVPESVGAFLQQPPPVRLRVGDRWGNEEGDLYFFGRITYTDERGSGSGNTRLSVFRRKWNPMSSYFNPDEEYSD